MASFYVSKTGSDFNNGSESAPFLTIPYAITNASNGDTIYVMDGTFECTTTITINKELTIRSLNGKANAILNKITDGDFFSIQSNNVTITDITIQASTTNSLISISKNSDGTNLPTKYTNINITNNNLKMYKYGVAINGGNITVTGNSFSRNGGTERLSLFLVYYIRDTITISNNTHTDNLRTQRFVYLTSAGTASTAYLDRVNSKGGNLIINNNTINTSLNTTQKPIMFIQDYYNTYTYGTVGSDVNYNSNTKLDITMDGNTMIGNSTQLCDFFVQYMTSDTCLNSYSKVTLTNNTLSNANVGILKLDAPSSVIIVSSIITLQFLFFIYNNTITTFSSPFPRTDFTGDQVVSQLTSLISPANIYSLENTSFISTVAPKQNQTIAFGALSSQPYSLNGKIVLSAISTSGLTVSYSSNNTSVVDVLGNTLIINGVGTAIITASQAGDNNYNAAINVSQNQVITKANQTIAFDDSSYTFSDPTYSLNATASSSLPVTYTSSNNDIASIFYGNTLVFTQNGQVNVTASQSGNNNYNQATFVVRKFVKNSMQDTNYAGGEITVTAAANNIITYLSGTLNITLQSNNFTKTLGVAYLINSGFTGGVSIVNIIAVDGDGNPITDFLEENLLINLILPQANPMSILKMYKLDTNNSIMNPQPNGYPVTLQYQESRFWTALLPSLSTYLIQDTNAPWGGGGGDPHIRTIYGKDMLLPNDWLYVKLYQKDDIKVNAKCAFIDSDFIKKLHNLRNRNDDSTIFNLDPTIHKYASNITYFVEIDIFKNDELVFKHDLLNDKELINKNITVEKNKFSKGLYSLMHKSFWPAKNLSSFFIHLNKNNILCIDIDNFWDDINYISIKLFDTNNEGYSGEFFNYSIENKLL